LRRVTCWADSRSHTSWSPPTPRSRRPMQIDFTTPALLLPAISLVLLAHTQRFLGLASVIRGLHDKLRHQPSPALAEQIASLTRRVMLVRNMQFLGVAGLLASVLAMLAIFAGRPALGP